VRRGIGSRSLKPTKKEEADQSSTRASPGRQQATPVRKRCLEACMPLEAPFNLLFRLSVTNSGAIIGGGGGY